MKNNKTIVSLLSSLFLSLGFFFTGCAESNDAESVAGEAAKEAEGQSEGLADAAKDAEKEAEKVMDDAKKALDH